jgi:isopenicillin N synthase-like dioxygenase
VKTLSVPVIDVSGWGSTSGDARQAVAGAVDEAASTVGFMQIVGHGIPDGAVTALDDAIDGFFSLTPEAKTVLRPSSPRINRGYSAPHSERLSYSLGVPSPADLFEAFNVGRPADEFPDLDLPVDVYAANLWPTSPASFRPAVQRWFDHATSLAHTMTEIFAAALGLPAGFFEPFTDHSIDVLRMNHYQVPDRDIRLEPDQLGMGPHTDFGIVTILWADALPGLQILDADGDWHHVTPRKDALLINLGDLLARWTNDRWRSTLHRVLAPIDAEGRPYRRRSAAFFHDGNADAVITTLPGVAVGAGTTYEPITVTDHLAAKLGGSRSLEINTAAPRDAIRVTTSRSSD